MTARPIASRCQTAPCVICEAPVHTCELGECPDGADMAHMDGGQLGSGAWVCSEACWETASAWPPPVDRERIAKRALGLFMVWLCCFGLFVSQPIPLLRATALSLIVAALWGLIHWAAMRLPPDPVARLTSRGRR